MYRRLDQMVSQMVKEGQLALDVLPEKSSELSGHENVTNVIKAYWGLSRQQHLETAFRDEYDGICSRQTSIEGDNDSHGSGSMYHEEVNLRTHEDLPQIQEGDGEDEDMHMKIKTMAPTEVWGGVFFLQAKTRMLDRHTQAAIQALVENRENSQDEDPGIVIDRLIIELGSLYSLLAQKESDLELANQLAQNLLSQNHDLQLKLRIQTARAEQQEEALSQLQKESEWKSEAIDTLQQKQQPAAYDHMGEKGLRRAVTSALPSKRSMLQDLWDSTFRHHRANHNIFEGMDLDEVTKAALEENTQLRIEIEDLRSNENDLVAKYAMEISLLQGMMQQQAEEMNRLRDDGDRFKFQYEKAVGLSKEVDLEKYMKLEQQRDAMHEILQRHHASLLGLRVELEEWQDRYNVCNSKLIDAQLKSLEKEDELRALQQMNASLSSLLNSPETHRSTSMAHMTSLGEQQAPTSPAEAATPRQKMASRVKLQFWGSSE